MMLAVRKYPARIAGYAAFTGWIHHGVEIGVNRESAGA